MKDFCVRCKGKKQQSGFSLLEVLVVVAILAILVIVGLFFFQRHMMRARDAQRKTDLDEIRFAFEEYYHDNRCYPPGMALYECGSSELSPYLKEVPCDPLTGAPYIVDYLNGEQCKGFRILTSLEIEDDADITAVGCDPETGCPNTPNDVFANYGTAMGASVGDAVAWANALYDVSKWYCIEEQQQGGERKFSCSRLEYSQLAGEHFCTQAFEDDTSCENACLEHTFVEGVTCQEWP